MFAFSAGRPNRRLVARTQGRTARLDRTRQNLTGDAWKPHVNYNELRHSLDHTQPSTSTI